MATALFLLSTRRQLSCRLWNIARARQPCMFPALLTSVFLAFDASKELLA